MEKSKEKDKSQQTPESTHALTAEWIAKHMPRRKKRIAWYRKG